jgi:hypothetical protein
MYAGSQCPFYLNASSEFSDIDYEPFMSSFSDLFYFVKGLYFEEDTAVVDGENFSMETRLHT